MNPYGLRTREWNRLLAFAAEVREANHRPRTAIVDDEGYSHVRRGGYGNEERSNYGYTKAEAENLRRILETPLTLDEAEGALAAGLVAIDDGARYSNTMTNAERQAKHREGLRERGLCVINCNRPARDGMSTCQECSSRAADRVAKRREEAKLARV